ncbi:class I alpha-mannosidase, glycoside hydrolase family 47 protein, partial [Pseudohyphozyma bogoriensis]
MKEHAWGHDEVRPISSGFADPYNGWGATLIDSLSTLLIMGLQDEYNLAREHVRDLDFTLLLPRSPACYDFAALAENLPPVEKLGKMHSCLSPYSIPVFETIIRYLGGLLSAYDLSLDPLMLLRATELGDYPLPALSTHYGLAKGALDIRNRENPRGRDCGRSNLAEVGSLEVEFARLSLVTGDEKYFRAAQRGIDTLDERFEKEDGGGNGRLGTLLPTWVDAGNKGRLKGSYTLGGSADSYYEYLIKMHQLVGGTLPRYAEMYVDALDSAKRHLLKPLSGMPRWENMTVAGSKNHGVWNPRLEHLACFAGGMIQLGAKLLEREEEDLSWGVNVTNACVWAYEVMETGVGPEAHTFFEEDDEDRWLGNSKSPFAEKKLAGRPPGVKEMDGRGMGRPETIEAVFYSWRISGDEKWRERGWDMFTRWVEATVVEAGFAGLKDVNDKEGEKVDEMQSFVLAETLKYYYLLVGFPTFPYLHSKSLGADLTASARVCSVPLQFSPPDLISLDDYVFNTEAHPLRIVKPGGRGDQEGSGMRFWDPNGVNEEEGKEVGRGTELQKWMRMLRGEGIRLNGEEEGEGRHVTGAAGAYVPLRTNDDADAGLPLARAPNKLSAAESGPSGVVLGIVKAGWERVGWNQRRRGRLGAVGVAVVLWVVWASSWTYSDAPARPSSSPIADWHPSSSNTSTPSSPFPWAHLPATWPGHSLLHPSRLSTPKPPRTSLPPLPQKYLAALLALPRQLPIPDNELVLTHDGWVPPGVRMGEVKEGKGVRRLPRVQFEGRVREEDEKRNIGRREWVDVAFRHAWEAYKEHAWGHDEVKPVTCGFQDPFNGWGATLIDSLSTLLIMGLQDDYNLAREHVRQLDFTLLLPRTEREVCYEFDQLAQDLPPVKELGKVHSCKSPNAIPVFETIIRYLGGFLSAYDLSADPLMLSRAIELADFILPALGTHWGLAKAGLDIARKENPRGRGAGRSNLAEVGSLELEFARLSMVTGDEKYFRAAQRGIDTLDKRFPTQNVGQKGRLGTLLPMFFDAQNNMLLMGSYTLGGGADSYYEYLIKMHQLVGGTLPRYADMYVDAVDSAKSHLLKPLTGFAGGWDNLTVAGSVLGARLLKREEDMVWGVNVTNACAWAYQAMETGVGPEAHTFSEGSGKYKWVGDDDE